MELILSTKLKNAISKANPSGEYEFCLKNVVINGSKRGCSGFVKSASNGSVVYVTTELTCMPQLGFMYRYADNTKDYTGYHNRWAKGLKDLSENIVNLLQKTPAEARDFRI